MNSEPLEFHRQLTRAELDSILIHIIRCPEVMQVAKDRVKVSDFDEQAEFPYKVLWSLALDFYNKQQQLIPQGIMEMELRRIFEEKGHPQLQSQHVQDSIVQIMINIYLFQDLIPSYAFTLLRSFIWQRQFCAPLLRAVEQGAVTPKMWDKLKDAERSTQGFTQSVEVTPFDINAAPMTGVLPRNPTELRFLDEMLNGGTRPGELYGFIAPSGGGKTTFAAQLALSVARTQHHVLFFTYEQPLNPEYFIPVYACATKIPRRIWEQMPPGSKPEEILQGPDLVNYQKAMREVSTYLHFIDMSGEKDRSGFGGVDEIDLKIADWERRKGVKVSAIILDWFWPIVVRSYNTLEVSYGKRVDLRIYAQGMTESLKQLCAKRQVWCWLPHQVNPDIASRKKEIDFEDAAELKSFAWFMTGCFCVAKADEDGLTTIKFSKARNAKVSKRVMELAGEVATFIPKDGDMQFDKRQKKFVEKDKMNAVPGADGRELPTRDAYAGSIGVGAVR